MGLIKEYKIYGDALFEHKPTIRALLLHFFYNKFINNERSKVSVYREKASFQDPNKLLEGIETKHVAIIIDGQVKELIRLQSHAADILLSKNAKFVEFDPQKISVKKGTEYKNSKFVVEEIDEKD
jgi:hypothetical protein